jgi:lactate racemase
MRLHLDRTGPEARAFHVPEGRLVADAAPRRLAAAAPEDHLVEAALAAPLDAPTLAEAAANARRILLLIDDATRATPTARLLPHLDAQLQAAGVPDDAITILVAPGTHRTMTPDEVDAKAGVAFARRWRIIQHDYRDTARLHDFGDTPEGLPVVANQLLATHDLVIGIGSVGVHGLMGYSGGAKIVLPGVAGDDSERWTHWRAATKHAGPELMGVPDNPLRRAIEAGARLAGLHAVLNVVVDAEGRVQHAAYGDFVSAQRSCARAAYDRYAVSLTTRADVVVVDAAPAERDYWQSIKGLYAADPVVRDGGQVVLVAANPEGVADNHPNVLELAGRSYDEIRALVDGGDVDDVIGAAVAALTARFRARFDVHLVSPGVTKTEARALGFSPHADVPTAVQQARRAAGAGADVAVLRRGGALLPLVPGVNRHLARRPTVERPRAVRSSTSGRGGRRTTRRLRPGGLRARPREG